MLKGFTTFCRKMVNKHVGSQQCLRLRTKTCEHWNSEISKIINMSELNNADIRKHHKLDGLSSQFYKHVMKSH